MKASKEPKKPNKQAKRQKSDVKEELDDLMSEKEIQKKEYEELLKIV